MDEMKTKTEIEVNIEDIMQVINIKPTILELASILAARHINISIESILDEIEISPTTTVKELIDSKRKKTITLARKCKMIDACKSFLVNKVTKRSFEEFLVKYISNE